ncbi:MAG: prepilin-type N-terminal cleavage/methylation domain-containing protein [Sulfurospirillum sp.]|nr:prepilin-type N-terminal cleavage/methylation domain-containing protein [Sulfurospirillum sp.]
MRRAFTMLELIFVIVVVGIISVLILPSFNRNNLQEAADQLVSHIRYTQHLAMIDDRFDAEDEEWFKGRWQIAFINNNSSGNQWTYTVFSDWKGAHTGSPNKAVAGIRSEYATNPLDTTKYLTCGDSGTNIVHYGDPEVTDNLCLGDTYGITAVSVNGGNTGSSSSRIVFDALGRPYRGNSRYFNNAAHRIMTTQVQIILSNSSDSITIAIEPETGYAHIL